MSAISAIGQLKQYGRAEAIIPFIDHPDPDVRFYCAFGLGGQETAIPALIQLSRDPESDVRDWATFGLTLLFDQGVDSEEIRSAMADRLTDQDDDTRGEALLGLVQYLDYRAIPPLLSELSNSEGQLRTPIDYRSQCISIVLASRSTLGVEWAPVLYELDRQGMVE